MPALNKAPVGKKKLLVKNDKQVATIFSRVFSPKFYDKVVTKALKYFKITPDNIERVNQYVSDNLGHSFVTVFFKSNKVLTDNDNRIFQKDMKKVLNSTGYNGKVKGGSKFQKMYGKSRRAVEIPMIWKSKSLGGCYCMLFERFS